ncbi:hypothetical protein H0H81_006285 [Sphagnurus paluster]|uniref:Zn(2)-C6 fungal-type domain-containing protein n=1 Tax=Sphagnurus paluster TaxID=117069 RepID=A0A9P7KM08_9AGAR|nr:hypothetical protein H0H81_006285 [Sphagnurus paluster]
MSLPSPSTSGSSISDHLPKRLALDPTYAQPQAASNVINPNEKRVALACMRCRTKRARCSGDKPVCRACEKAKEECLWPSGRRRKRTRREMEEEERRERAAAVGGDGRGSGIQMRIGAISWDQAEQHHHQHHQPASLSLDLKHPLSIDPQWTDYAAMNQMWAPPLFSPADAREKDASQLVRALEAQVAFIDGDPARNEDLELYYYRFSGSTAIHPGINRISLKLQPLSSSQHTSSPVASASSPSASTHFVPPTPALPSASFPYTDADSDLFDAHALPKPHIYLPLLETFFRTMGRHFPSVNRKRMEERLETGTMNFIRLRKRHRSRMAIRMAMDLGLHEISEIYESPAHVVRTRLLFWSLFVTDRILAFSTGRPPTISEDIIEIPLPSNEDFVPDPARSDPAAAAEAPQPTPFVHMVRLMVLCGRIASVLNGRRGKARTLVGEGASWGGWGSAGAGSGAGAGLGGMGDGSGGGGEEEVLKGLQTHLVEFYKDLPEGMKWSVDAFKCQEARGHGVSRRLHFTFALNTDVLLPAQGSFLTLHLWANAVLALVFHPELMSRSSGTETPFSQNMERSIKLSLSSSRIIAECLVFADLLAFIHDMKTTGFSLSSGPGACEGAGSKPQTVEDLLSTLARQNLSVLTKAIQRMEHYWAGISYVTDLLEKHAAGLGFQRLDPVLKARKTFISLPDKGLLRRFTNTNLPHDTAPPTQTSLRASIARGAGSEANNNPSPTAEPCSLDDLLNTYSIEGFFVQPADPFDLEGLLASGYNPAHGHALGAMSARTPPNGHGHTYYTVNGTHVEGENGAI